MSEVESQTVYLSLGSNLGNRRGNLEAALDLLGSHLEDISVSSLYATQPVGVRGQPEFLNLVASGKTQLEPGDLLACLKEIEHTVGRRPTYRWGPRVLDIDILLYGDRTLENSDLIIPHREMYRRAFVLIPLTEIAPAVRDPFTGKTMRQLRDEVSESETVRRAAPPLRPPSRERQV